MTEVQELLTAHADEIVEQAATALARSSERHYSKDGPDVARERLRQLLGLVAECISTRNLEPMIAHATAVAKERFEAGFDIREVQIAFHVLEEAVWDRVIASTAPDALIESIGLVGTVLGAGRDALAREYVSLASQQHVTSLDLGALFRGGQ